MALKCPLCKDPVILKIDEKNVEYHLIVTRDKLQHYHVHGPISKKAVIQDFVIKILEEAGIGYSIAPEPGESEEAPEEASEIPEDEKE